MMFIFTDMIEDIMEVFMDDFPIYGSSFSVCLSNICRVLRRCEEKNLVLKWEKAISWSEMGSFLDIKFQKRALRLTRLRLSYDKSIAT